MAFSSYSKVFTPVTDTEDQMRKHIRWLLLARVLLFTLLIGISTLLQAIGHDVILPPTLITLGFLLFVYIFSILSTALLSRKKNRLKRFGILQILNDTLLTAILIYATGCSQSIFTPVFILPIIAGGLIFYKIGGLIPATAATFFYGAILTLEFFGYIPSYFLFTPYRLIVNALVSMNMFSVYGLIFFLTAFLSGIVADRLRSTEDALSRTSMQLDRISSLYQQIVDDITTGIITIDALNRITSCNPAAEIITGYSQDELRGEKLKDYFSTIYRKSEGRHVAELLKKNSKTTRVVYSYSTLHMGNFQENDKNPDDSWKIVTLEDISKIEQMEKQIIDARKMAAIGELSASIAHDFRNPLAAIYGSAQIIAMELDSTNYGEKNTQQKLTEIILRESERMSSTITEFLQFARPALLKAEWFDLKRLFLETIEQVATDSPFVNCLIEAKIDNNLDAWGDRQQIQTALFHLLTNACHACKNCSDSIKLEAQEKKDYSKSSYISIIVADRGTGIEQGIQEKIFEPFFSTKENGSGLGLAIVKSLIERHEGSLIVASKENQGCIVTINLPLPPTHEPS